MLPIDVGYSRHTFIGLFLLKQTPNYCFVLGAHGYLEQTPNILQVTVVLRSIVLGNK